MPQITQTYPLKIPDQGELRTLYMKPYCIGPNELILGLNVLVLAGHPVIVPAVESKAVKLVNHLLKILTDWVAIFPVLIVFSLLIVTKSHLSIFTVYIKNI